MDIYGADYTISKLYDGIAVIRGTDYIMVRDNELAGKLAALPENSTYEDAVDLVSKELAGRKIDVNVVKDMNHGPIRLMGLGDGKFAVVDGSLCQVYESSDFEKSVDNLKTLMLEPYKDHIEDWGKSFNIEHYLNDVKTESIDIESKGDSSSVRYNIESAEESPITIVCDRDEKASEFFKKYVEALEKEPKFESLGKIGDELLGISRSVGLG